MSRDFRPSPGRVVVLRKKVESKFGSLYKPDTVFWREEIFDTHAVVCRIGDTIPGGLIPWFEKGDEVVIEPSIFNEVALTGELTVWHGPFAGIQGVFEDTEETEETTTGATDAETGEPPHQDRPGVSALEDAKRSQGDSSGDRG